MATKKTTITPEEVLQWQLSLLGVKRPLYLENYLMDYYTNGITKHTKTIDDISGRNLLEFLDKTYGNEVTINDYLKLTERLDPYYLNQVQKFLQGGFTGLHSKKYSSYTDYLVEEKFLETSTYNYLKSNGLRETDKETIDKLLIVYFNYQGIRNGYILSSDNTATVRVDFNDILVQSEMVKELYLVINGVFRPDISEEDDSFLRGDYNKTHSYSAIKFMVHDVLTNHKELVGLGDMRIKRNRILTDILTY